MEMNEKEQIFGILCGTVDRLRSKKEYDIIESLYSNLLKCDLIHSIEDFKAGKIIKGSMEEALLFRFHLAFVKSKTRDDLPIPEEMKDAPCTLEELSNIF